MDMPYPKDAFYCHDCDAVASYIRLVQCSINVTTITISVLVDVTVKDESVARKAIGVGGARITLATDQESPSEIQTDKVESKILDYLTEEEIS